MWGYVVFLGFECGWGVSFGFLFGFVFVGFGIVYIVFLFLCEVVERVWLGFFNILFC